MESESRCYTGCWHAPAKDLDFDLGVVEIISNLNFSQRVSRLHTVETHGLDLKAM